MNPFKRALALLALLGLLAAAAPRPVAAAEGNAECCRVTGRPLCCFFYYLDLWWNGHMDFPDYPPNYPPI